ncbi:hypothetical protein EXN66_Car018918 [Channa argus]|uniref:Uncharacterized protein n=1 Tax=Channa argus TaxID=215402 RepID=A0A6G1QKK2_CHAAH|nr:hypothetical protein EXN66_Car018918 [Channa argus]
MGKFLQSESCAQKGPFIIGVSMKFKQQFVIQKGKSMPATEKHIKHLKEETQRHQNVRHSIVVLVVLNIRHVTLCTQKLSGQAKAATQRVDTKHMHGPVTLNPCVHHKSVLISEGFLSLGEVLAP